MKIYTARLVEGTKNSFNIEFRHPVLRDNNGKQGRKIRRGLGTDKDLAEKTVEYVNEILKDNTLWSLSAKEYVEGKYGEKVTEIFYDKMIEETSEESEAIRESILAMPSDKEYSISLFTGGTGVGKTTDIRAILGLDDDELSFPAVSPTRTTTFNSEYIFATGKSEAVVTFLNEQQIVNLIQESINNGVKRISLECKNGGSIFEIKKKICSDFMNHQENRFRLNYILGQYFESKEKLERRIKAYTNRQIDNDFINLETNNKDIELILESIISIYEKIKYDGFGSDVDDNEVENTEDVKKCEENQVIIDIVLKHIRETLDIISEKYKDIGKFKSVRNWPIYWYGKSDSLKNLIEPLEYIGGNNSKFFGRLLTPLVDGVRMKSPFNPRWNEGKTITPKLVIIDSEGEGHSGKKITSLPLTITNKFNSVDAIIIVDKADDAMKGISQVILNEALSRGSYEKIIMLYNRFENIDGANLFDDDDKEEFIYQIQNNAIKQMKDDYQLSEDIIEALIRRIESNTFFLKNVNESYKSEETLQTFQDIVKKVEKLGIERKTKVEDIPEYELDKVIIANIRAKSLFKDQWDAYLGNKSSSNFQKQHWSKIKALSNRFSNWAGWLSYDNLTPVSDMSSYIMIQLSEFLQHPKCWKYENNIDDNEKRKIINLIQQKVSIQINDLIKERMKINQYKQWVKAFSYRGNGSTLYRKNDIEKIFDNVMPNVTLSYSEQSEEFILAIKVIIENSINDIQKMYD